MILFTQDKEDDMYTRDFTGATLEDHFDKTVLPKAMQVKNFGRSGRTKYTHLVDQDTTEVGLPRSQSFLFWLKKDYFVILFCLICILIDIFTLLFVCWFFIAGQSVYFKGIKFRGD